MPIRYVVGSAALVAAIGLSTAHAQVVATPYSYNTILDSSAPVFDRPLDGVPPTALSGVSLFHYGALTFIPDTTGVYVLETTFTGLRIRESALVLYQGSFNPGSPLNNALQAASGNLLSTGGLAQLTQSLVAGMPYVLVTTTLTPGVEGTFTSQISGPSGATLNLVAPAAPEPSTLALLGIALAALPLARRRKMG